MASATRKTRTNRHLVRDYLAQLYTSEWQQLNSGDWQRELLVSLLFRTSIKLQTAFDRQFLRFGMTAQEAAVLVRCDAAGQISMGKLALIMGRDKAKITRFVARLEGGGLLARRPHPLDHRSSVIELTNQGQELVPRLNSVFEKMRKRLFAGIQPGEVDLLAAVLSQLFANVGHLK